MKTNYIAWFSIYWLLGVGFGWLLTQPQLKEYFPFFVLGLIINAFICVIMVIKDRMDYKVQD